MNPQGNLTYDLIRLLNAEHSQIMIESDQLLQYSKLIEYHQLINRYHAQHVTRQLFFEISRHLLSLGRSPLLFLDVPPAESVPSEIEFTGINYQEPPTSNNSDKTIRGNGFYDNNSKRKLVSQYYS